MSSRDRDHVGATIADDVRQGFCINITMTTSACRARIPFPSAFDIVGWQRVRSRSMDKSPITEPHTGTVVAPAMNRRDVVFFEAPSRFALIG